MFKLVASLVSYPARVVRDVKTEIDQLRRVTAALNYYAQDDVPLPNNFLEIFR